jgi:N-acetylglutamate synthase-like GNAT family acetyltransferase
MDIGWASDGDLPEIRALLRACALQDDDVGRPGQRFLVARSGAELLGCIGFEVHGQDGLLRSFAVAPGQRRRGLGAALHDRAVKEAAALGVRRLFLLTTTVRERALRAGFMDVPRELVPASIREGDQFRSLCPASAACMVLRLP